jgi:hypothetical protein
MNAKRKPAAHRSLRCCRAIKVIGGSMIHPRAGVVVERAGFRELTGTQGRRDERYVPRETQHRDRDRRT